MFDQLPNDPHEFMNWSWEKIEPFFQDLIERPLNADNVQHWLADWTRLYFLISETYARLAVATTVNTADKDAEQRYENFLDQIYPPSQARDQALKEKLLASGLEPDGFEVPLRNMRAEAELFRQENLPLLSEEIKLGTRYDKIAGAQTVEWDGQEIPLLQLRPLNQEPDRSVRERAWRLGMQRQLADREAYNQLWIEMLRLRRQIAENAGLPDYRAYQWRAMHRFDYTPEDARRFQEAIEASVVPAVERLLGRRQQLMDIDSVRPWDVEVDPLNRPPLHPFGQVDELKSKAEDIFRQVDPELGEYFHTMRQEDLLDLDNRKNKAPGGYCTDFSVSKRPFIFMNAVGIHEDVQTLLHEGGHSFHFFESTHLPYHQQQQMPMEFAEVASMSMELLAAPYLDAAHGGYYTPAEAARARIEHLETSLRFWPYMAVVDAFQHWVYEHPDAAEDPANCDEQWATLWRRFMRGYDWSGLEEEMKTGWHRKLHIFQIPFYYIEYGLAQLGAFQVWRNALDDQAAAVRAYRQALSLGGTVPLPALFQAAGARLAFDTETLQAMVDLAMRTIEELEQQTTA